MPAPKRPNYFQSQFLVVRDFKDEQTYHQEMLRRHNRLMHDWGVVRAGLQVTKPAKAGDNFTISAGSAIDSLGREIVLEPKSDSSPQAWILGADKVQAARDTAGSQDVSITIAFQEFDSDDPLDKYPPPGGQDNVTRQMQVPLIAATKTPGNEVVVLAVVKADGSVDNSVRKLANGFIGVSGSNDLYIGTGRRVGIGTMTPQVPLHVKGNAAILNLEGDTYGFVQFYPKGFAAGRKGWLGFGDAGDSHLRIQHEADSGNLLLGSLKGYIGIAGSGGDGQGIQFGNREIKFRGDKIQHFSIFANKVSNALTFAKSGSTENMDTVDGTIMTLADSGYVGVGTTKPEERLQIGEGVYKISMGPTLGDGYESRSQSLWDKNYGVSYLGFNAVRTNNGWRREGLYDKRGASIIYNNLEGELCFVTLGSQGEEYLDASEVVARRRMVIGGSGNVSIAKDLSVNGNLGIGTTGVPAAKLHLGSGTLQIGTTETSVTTIDSAITHKFGVETTPRYTIDRDLLGNGQAGIGFNMRKAPSATIAANGSAVGIPAAGTLAFSTSDGTNLVERMRIDSAGNVGIGTTDPKAKLVVQQELGVMDAVQARRMINEGKDGLLLDLDFTRVQDAKTLDLSPNKKDATQVGGVQIVPNLPPFGPSGTKLDGTGYLTVPDLNADFSQGFTIEVWYQMDISLSTPKEWSRIIDFGNGPNGDNILLTFVAGKPYFAVFRGASAQQFSAANPLPYMSMSHLAVTIDKDGNAKLYINGQLNASGGVQLPASVVRANNYIGKSNWTADPNLQAFLGNLRIYNRALTPDEINADMQEVTRVAALPGVTADMIKKYSAGKAVFVSGNTGAGRNSDGGIEVRHASLTQGVGLGYNTIYATGYQANQSLTIQARGRGNLFLNPDNGNVGIGTITPTQAKLVVKGSVNRDLRGYAYLAYRGLNSQASTAGNISQPMDYSIYATNCIAAMEFHSFSDERTKNIRGRSDSATDLDTLLSIEITDYRYKDLIGKGTAPHKKVIAQQVEKVFPQAVSKHTDVVPDIYRPASFVDGWVALATDLKKGERVKLITEQGEEVHEVLEVTPDKFRVDFKPEGDKLFVFGREVDDFLTVDYDAISMLNVSATQQLKKEKDEDAKVLRTKIVELKAANDALMKRLQMLESKMETAPDVVVAKTSNGNGRQ